MNIIPHRGFWSSGSDKNSKTSILDALEFFDGIEIDLRDKDSSIVVAHDPFSDGVKFEDILASSSRLQRQKVFALNVKSDGIGNEIKRILKKNQIKNYFIFDLSFPELIKYRSLDMTIYERISEYEKPFFYSSGLVVDCFKKDSDLHFLPKVKNYFFISPELHGRNPYPMWKKLSCFFKKKSSSLSICTDFPLELFDFWCKDD